MSYQLPRAKKVAPTLTDTRELSQLDQFGLLASFSRFA